MSRLGGALFEPGAIPEAEVPLLAGYEGMKARETKIPRSSKPGRPGEWSDSTKRGANPAGRMSGSRSSDLLICGILMWSQIRGFRLTDDRVDQPQIGAWIGKLPGVEMLQQMSNRAIGSRVRHRMDLHTQYPLFHVRHQVGLGLKQIAQQTASVVGPGQLLGTIDAIAVSAR